MRCVVLDDARTLLAFEAVAGALGRAGEADLERGARGGGRMPPRFLHPRLLRPFVRAPFFSAAHSIPYLTPEGSHTFGYEPDLVLYLAQAYLDCRDYHIEHNRSIPIRYQEAVRISDLMVRGLATSGVRFSELVEQAVRLEQPRAVQTRQRLWQTCLRVRPDTWRPVFPQGFYEHIHRLWRWSWTSGRIGRPRLIGRITNEIVYRRLGVDLPEELQRRNPADAQGRRTFCHHQFFDAGVGLPALTDQIAQATSLMERADTWATFMKQLNYRCPIGREGLAVYVHRAQQPAPLDSPEHQESVHEIATSFGVTEGLGPERFG